MTIAPIRSRCTRCTVERKPAQPLSQLRAVPILFDITADSYRIVSYRIVSYRIASYHAISRSPGEFVGSTIGKRGAVQSLEFRPSRRHHRHDAETAKRAREETRLDSRRRKSRVAPIASLVDTITQRAGHGAKSGGSRAAAGRQQGGSRAAAGGKKIGACAEASAGQVFATCRRGDEFLLLRQDGHAVSHQGSEIVLARPDRLTKTTSFSLLSHPLLPITSGRTFLVMTLLPIPRDLSIPREK